jgi:hypothetical protein
MSIRRANDRSNGKSRVEDSLVCNSLNLTRQISKGSVYFSDLCAFCGSCVYLTNFLFTDHLPASFASHEGGTVRLCNSILLPGLAVFSATQCFPVPDLPGGCIWVSRCALFLFADGRGSNRGAGEQLLRGLSCIFSGPGFAVKL